jgi:predicted MFS family arabinose efflux permease
MKLWTGQTISELGSHITRDGLPLVGVLTLNAAPSQMGALAASGTLPVLIFGLIAGVWVDRLRRRPILIAADIARAVILLTIPAAALLGRLSMLQLSVVLVLTGILTVFFDVAYRSYLPALVGRADLTEGNAKLEISSSIAEIGGSGIAGALVQALTAPIAIFLDALSFLASVISLALIRKPEAPPPPAAARRRATHEIRDGLNFLFRQPILRAFAVTAAIRGFFGNFFAALYSLYAIRVLGLGPAALGLAIAMGGLGSLAGALAAQRIGRRYRLGAVLIGAYAVRILAGLLTALAGGSVALAAGMLMGAQFLGDAAETLYGINEVSLRQTVTPDGLLGRVNASAALLPQCAAPLGALAGGVLAELIGVRSTIFLAVLGPLLGLAWLVLSPVRNLRDNESALNPRQL